MSVPYTGIITYTSIDRLNPLNVSTHPVTFWQRGTLVEGVDWIRGDHWRPDAGWTDDALAMLAAYKLTRSVA